MKNFTTQLIQTNQGAFRLSKLDIISPTIPNAFNGYRIVQLADLHYGPITALTHLQAAFKLAMNQAPDLIALTGDNIQNSALGLRKDLATHVNPKVFQWTQYRRNVRKLTKELSQLFALLHAPDGLIAVLGNHEYTEGMGTIRRILDPRINWLRNERTFIQRGQDCFEISGLDDLTRGKPDLAKALTHPASSHNPFFKLHLSHNPDITIKDPDNLLQDTNLILSGHTHGGQICLPFIGPVVTRTDQKKHVSGLSQHTTGSWVYVSNGIGYGGVPIRFLCPPEVVVITLKN